MQISKKIEDIMSGLVEIINKANLFFDYSFENKIKINKLLKNIHEPKPLLKEPSLNFIKLHYED